MTGKTEDKGDEYELAMDCPCDANRGDFIGAECASFPESSLAIFRRARNPAEGESFARFAARGRCHEGVFPGGAGGLRGAQQSRDAGGMGSRQGKRSRPADRSERIVSGT